jgi:NAD(P)-dependent dehydrogenase (short-subunit alcohol dehydrogenase family)
VTVAVVTGGNRGIGYEICKGLAREGVRVVLCSRDAAAGEKAAAAVARDGGALESRPLDVNDEASVAALARWLEERHGRIDILVNNAAVLEDRDRVTGPLELDVGVLARMLDTNVCGSCES